MTCPVCGGRTNVIYCKADCEGVYRRRNCLECGHRFYTSEQESDGADFKRLDATFQREQRRRRKSAKSKT